MIKTLGKKAFYKEEEYEFMKKSDGSFAIYSNDKKTLDLGFKQITHSESRFIKLVNLEDLDFIFEKDTTVIYKGDEFKGSIIEDDQIMLYTRNVPLGRKHQMIIRDKDEYYLYVNLKDVDEIIQRWIPYK